MDAITELSYALDTFYFLVSGVLVMWMAAGFSMLEAGMVRAKNTAEILTKNISLFAVASIMYMLYGYSIMYPAEAVNAWWPGIGSILGSSDNTAAEVIASGGDTYYSGLSDFFFQVVFVATAMSIVSGAVAERMKLWAFLVFAVVMTGFISTDIAIESMKLGAHEFITKPFDLDHLTGMINRLIQRTPPIQGLETFSKIPKPAEGTIIGMTPEMVEIAKIIGQVAATDASVLILGESGTGKELVARAIYANSLRADKPFLSVNCAALPETLLESELFGHEKGAFTGAYTRKLGKFEQCNAGTIFLDEVADMSLMTQSKVLRVLQEQEFERVGGN